MFHADCRINKRRSSGSTFCVNGGPETLQNEIAENFMKNIGNIEFEEGGSQLTNYNFEHKLILRFDFWGKILSNFFWKN